MFKIDIRIVFVVYNIVVYLSIHYNEPVGLN